LSPAVKYSNWVVTTILLLIGARVLFVVLRWVLGSNDSWRDRPWVPLAQAIHAVLFLIAAMGIFRWRDWGRLLAIAICAWNIFATLFLTRLGPNHRVAGLTFCGVLVLLIIWLQLSKIKLQFVRPG
jgi:hypothetical protein